MKVNMEYQYIKNDTLMMESQYIDLIGLLKNVTPHSCFTGTASRTWAYVLCAGDVLAQNGRLVVRRDNGDRRRRQGPCQGVAACQRPVWLLAIAPSLVLDSGHRRNVAP